MRVLKLLAVLILVLAMIVIFATPVYAQEECGDVNGDGNVNVVDLVLVHKHILDIEEITCPDMIDRADLTGSGDITFLDAELLMALILGLYECD